MKLSAFACECVQSRDAARISGIQIFQIQDNRAQPPDSDGWASWRNRADVMLRALLPNKH